METMEEQKEVLTEKTEPTETAPTPEAAEAEQPEVNHGSGKGKSTPGYIRRYRRINIIWLIVWVLIGAGVFTTGWFIWHTRANILTVLAVLMVLPGAKRIVALIAAGRKKSVAPDRCRRIEEATQPFVYAGHLDLHEYEPEETDEEEDPREEREIPETVLFTDYIFTSTEKIMMLDFMVVTDGTVFILPSSINKDQEYVKQYLTRGIAKVSDAIAVRFVWDDEKLLKELSNLQESKAPLSDRREVLAYLKSLAV